MKNVDDKLQKLRPVIDSINKRLRLVPIEECLAADEKIIPFKDKTSLKQYNPKKPHKWGYKVFVLSGVSGFSYNFEIFTGKSDNICAPDVPDMRASSNVVVRLARIIPNFCNYRLYIDNWFNSIPLQIFMYERGILLLGTVRSDRLRQCQLPSEKEMKKEWRGSFLEKVATIDGVTLSAVSWYDNKIVTLLSNFVGSEPVTEVKRFSKAMKETIKIKCPNLVQEYNRHMGGVDLIDSLLGYYRNKIKSKKWYHLIFFHLIDMVIANAWILWRKNKNTDAHLVDFELAITNLLANAVKDPSAVTRHGRPSIETNNIRKPGPKANKSHSAIRFDSVGHWPVIRDNCS